MLKVIRLELLFSLNGAPRPSLLIECTDSVNVVFKSAHLVTIATFDVWV